MNFRRAVSTAAVGGLLFAMSSASGAEPKGYFYDAGLGMLVGGVSGPKWLSDQEAAKNVSDGVAWRFFTALEQVGQSKGAKPKPLEAPFEYAFGIEFEPEAPKREDEPVYGIAGDWNPLPRKPRFADVTIVAYRDAAREVLQDQGLKDPSVHLVQVVKVDLDNDGEDEAIVTTTRYKAGSPERPSANAAAGDYSVVFLRKVIDGKVKTFVLAAETYPKAKQFCAPNAYRVGAVLDLNGDGTMEIILRSSYYEGDGVNVYEVKEGKVKEVLSAGLGV